VDIRLIGGPYDGLRCILTATPPVVLVSECAYERVDDPDTGEFLGGYAFPYVRGE